MRKAVVNWNNGILEQWNTKERAVIGSISPFGTPLFQSFMIHHSNIPVFSFGFRASNFGFAPENHPPPVLDQSPICKHKNSVLGIGKSVFTRRGYMFKVRIVSRLALCFFVMALAGQAVAAEKAKPSGKVTVESTSIAAGVGVSWGDGKLNFKGKDYPFSVEGLSLVDWGISKVNATGDVYNLTDPAKFAGTYVAAEAGLTLAGGMGGMVLRNANDVIIHLRSVSQGAQLQLGTSGLIIKMK
jgi:hypothetical protein